MTYTWYQSWYQIQFFSIKILGTKNNTKTVGTKVGAKSYNILDTNLGTKP